MTGASPASGVIKLVSADLGTAGVGASEALSSFVAPASRSSGAGVSTGIAIAAAGSAVTLKLSLRDTKGSIVTNGQTTLQLAANGHTAGYLEQLFPNADTREFEGTITVTVEGGQAVATALQLGTRIGEFTTLPVTAIR
jgi:hypothetical protein